MSRPRDRRPSRRVRLLRSGAVAVLGAVTALLVARPPAIRPAQWWLARPGPLSTVDSGADGATRPPSSDPSPGGPRGSAVLLTNEYAHHHPDAADAVRSPDWIVTSGSLYRTGNMLWSGRPDDRAPGALSVAGTDSAVLRAISTRTDHADVRVTFGLQVIDLVTTGRTPGQDTDGVHAILHYQSEFSTYYVSMFRRDGQVTIKKKVPGGPSNGGTYYTLGARAYPLVKAWTGAWYSVETTIRRTSPGVVRLTLRIDGRSVLDVIDDGADAPAVDAPGRVGLRGDNTEFYVRDFTAEPLER